MEANTLKKKKNTISKGKLKRSIKNVLCRPDQLFWPEVTEEDGNKLESVLKKHKIEIHEVKKPHWKDLKNIPREQRPKPPKLKRVDGLLFGIRECSEAIQNGVCSAIVIEAKVDPRLIVQPIIEMCTAKDIHLLCLNDLKKVTATHFGVPTTCLGIKNNTLLDVKNEIIDISKNHLIPKQTNQMEETNENVAEIMDVVDDVNTKEVSNVTTFQFLHRTNKKTRVFVPTTAENVLKPTKQFIGQDFIEFSEKPEQKNSKAYMKMLLKRISNNPDRGKKK